MTTGQVTTESAAHTHVHAEARRGGGGPRRLTTGPSCARPHRWLVGWFGHGLDVQLLPQGFNFVYTGIDLLQSQLGEKSEICLTYYHMNVTRYMSRIHETSGSPNTW